MSERVSTLWLCIEKSDLPGSTKTLAEEELAELRAKASRCDAYERAGEALLAFGDMRPAPCSETAQTQLARCRARVEAAIEALDRKSKDDGASVIYAARKALQ